MVVCFLLLISSLLLLWLRFGMWLFLFWNVSFRTVSSVWGECWKSKLEGRICKSCPFSIFQPQQHLPRSVVVHVVSSSSWRSIISCFFNTWISRETRDPHSDDPKFPIKHSIGDVIYLPVDTTKESKSKREKEERGHFFSLIYSIQNMYLERYRYNNNPPPPPPHSSHWQTAWPSRYCSGLLVVSLFPFNNNTTTSNWELEQK